MNDDVRRSVTRLLSGSGTSDVRDVAGSLQEAAMAVLQAVREQSIQHAPLTIFVVAASVLLLFMFRT
ncbi:MAG TPA: hypothetical protein VHZ73_10810 [Vicinamibacterales bacterium]|nr:hypothetical protein [Vicinamibacterales bacterium]